MNYEIEVYLNPGDVPKYLRSYVRLSMKYYDAKRNELQKRICSMLDMVISEQDEVSKELQQSILDGLKQSLVNIDGMKDRGEFVDDSECNAAGITIDWKQYHLDKADSEFETVEEMEELRKVADTEELKAKVEESIETHKRFAFSHRKKAGGIGWNRLAKVSRALKKFGE